MKNAKSLTIVGLAFVLMGIGSGAPLASGWDEVVKRPILWPPGLQMVTVGLTLPQGFMLTKYVSIGVYANEQGDGGEATWNGTSGASLELRATRSGDNPSGRIYLLFYEVEGIYTGDAFTKGDVTAVLVCTAVVPHDESESALARATAAAAAAKNYGVTHGSAPPGYFFLPVQIKP
jgi:hypothetical protein